MPDQGKDESGMFRRTASAREIRKQAAAQAGPTESPTPENYDIKLEASKVAASVGHTLGKWKSAAEGTSSFWNTTCVDCGVQFYARWRQNHDATPFPDFGSPDKAGSRMCPGSETKPEQSFNAVKDE